MANAHGKMGAAQSQDQIAFFDQDAVWDADLVDVTRYIWQIERKLWSSPPPWAPPDDPVKCTSALVGSKQTDKCDAMTIDPWKRLVR